MYHPLGLELAKLSPAAIGHMIRVPLPKSSTFQPHDFGNGKNRSLTTVEALAKIAVIHQMSLRCLTRNAPPLSGISRSCTTSFARSSLG